MKSGKHACEALKDMPNVTVEPFSGLTVEYAAQRGLRPAARAARRFGF